MSKVCNNCQSVNEDGTKFCSSCGGNLGSDGPSASETVNRKERLSNYLSNKTLQGWNIIDRNDQDFTAVIVLPGKKVNHLLHFLIFVLTCCVWGIAWIIIYVNRKKEQRIRVSVDNSGRLIEETITL